MSSPDSPEQPLPEKDFDPNQLTLILRVTLSADRNAVDPVVQEVMAVVRQMNGVDGKEDAIELALQEALANAVIHGAKEDPTKVVECLVSSDQERGILIVVRDPGTGFTPEASSWLHCWRECLFEPRPRDFSHQPAHGQSRVQKERH
jgi:hypothetical protein